MSTIIYFLFGIAGYLWAGDNVQGDILRSFDADDQLIFIGRFGLLIAMFAGVNACMAIFSGSMANFLARKPAWLLAQRLLMGITLLALSAEMAIQAMG